MLDIYITTFKSVEKINIVENIITLQIQVAQLSITMSLVYNHIFISLTHYFYNLRLITIEKGIKSCEKGG